MLNIEFAKKTPHRLFVIGDVHGCASELSVLLDWLSSTINLGVNDQVVFVGDYIDRGPDSRETLGLIFAFKRTHPSTVLLKGNHEEMFLNHLFTPSAKTEQFIVDGGGAATALSFRCSEKATSQEYLDHIPDEWLRELMRLPYMYVSQTCIVVHAGLRPNVKLFEQEPKDLLWIRDLFLNASRESLLVGEPVIFGHTPQSNIMIDRPGRIGIDTGLVWGNCLSCIEVNSGEIYQVKFCSKKVKVTSISELSR